MTAWKRIPFWMSLLLFGAGCTCCPIGAIGSSPDLTPDDLVGTWASDQSPTITLNADGTFTAEHLNGCNTEEGSIDGGFGGDVVDPSVDFSLSGTWTLDGPERLNPYQNLRLGEDGQLGLRGYVWQAKADQIVFPLGDLDDYRFCYLARQPEKPR
jgi:hypothetical protein